MYVYKREDGSTFELSQKMSETALSNCPTTGQAVKRVISGGSGVVYKGTGWYVTDYKNKDNATPVSGCASGACATPTGTNG
jgi:predicted nucleic acid-binding Zn ribbon protein